jgi:predicted dehydrogenase/threonine dehydrogenase-like Zn-dependent dehydrogenase
VKQVAQRPRDGRIVVQEVPQPVLQPGWVLVRNHYSLISAGTEKSKLELGEQNLLQKARTRPDLAKQVLRRAKVEGVRSTVAVVRDRLDALAPIGYSSAGVVLELGAGVAGLAPGEPVACGGGGWANHADVVAVPRTLVARVPAGVALADAAYATVGAIALHAVRQSEARVGERVGVIGLGLVGQLAVRILLAAGCQAFGVDLDEDAVGRARTAGAQAFSRAHPAVEGRLAAATGGLGLDSVLVCAASPSSDPVELAAVLCRDRGRIVVVGDVVVSANRELLYRKELEVRLSRSYGPGRYDRDYEEHGRDLPPSYVRWTEQRNLEAFLGLLADGRLDVSSLTTHRFPVERADEAYEALSEAAPRAFGVLLEYQEEAPGPAIPAAPRPSRQGAVRVGLIGAGNFARATLLPALTQAGAELIAVTSAGGLTASDVATRFGFERVAASPEDVLSDDSIDAVVIATRHTSHASLAAAALQAGKSVFVEKPLALTEEELAEVEAELTRASLLMVGFNRRFAPLVEHLRRELASVSGRVLAVRINAGPLPPDHWLHDPEDGGGRLLGEACHFVDLLADLAGSAPVSVHAVALPIPERPLECSDSIAATLRFADGTVGNLVYAGSGDAGLPKERLEAFGGGIAAVLDDFRRLELYRNGKREVIKQAQDKGHRAEIARFVAAAAGREEPPPVSSYLATTRATLALAESLRTGLPVEVG